MRDGWFTSRNGSGEEPGYARLEALFQRERTPSSDADEVDPPSDQAEPEEDRHEEQQPLPVGSRRERAAGGTHRARSGESTVGRAWRARLDPGRRGAVAVVAAVVLAAGVVGWRAVADQPRSRAVPVMAQLSLGSTSAAAGSAPSSDAPAPTGASTGSSGSNTKIVVVDVTGRVRRPGLIRLPAGSRVDDAVRAAGGATAGTDLSTLNLARPLIDGEQISVGLPVAVGSGSGPFASGGTGLGTGSGSVLVNLNTASVEQLDGLPGVGPVLAQRIIDWRTTHGRFDSVDQLTQVTGVGDAKFADLKPLVTVS